MCVFFETVFGLLQLGDFARRLAIISVFVGNMFLFLESQYFVLAEGPPRHDLGIKHVPFFPWYLKLFGVQVYELKTLKTFLKSPIPDF